MPKAARLGDIASGHGCFPPSNIIAGSPDILINNIPAARITDAVAPHGCSKCTPHSRNISQGSQSVFMNGLAAARIGDSVNCGGAILSGSPDVLIGG
ncbi:MAG: PAAR domain-containing protein [Gammaproteobacteria bacterium]|nr:PAAR domain-containing protein [Gammaproteobacteria bacterium]